MKNNEKKLEASIFNILVLVIIYFLFTGIFPLFINIIIAKSTEIDLSIWLNVITVFSTNVIFLYAIKQYYNFEYYFGENINIKTIFLGIILAVALFGFFNYFLVPFLSKYINPNEYISQLESMKIFPLQNIVLTCLIAPLSEELFLRAYIVRGLYNKYNPFIAILVSSILFAVIHFNMIQGILAFIFGIAVGCLYLATGSIFSCIITHFLYNLFLYIAYSNFVLISF